MRGTKKKIALLLIFTFYCVPKLFSQILNIEKTRLDKDSSNYFAGTGSLGFTLFNRNTGKPVGDDFIGLNGTFDVVYFSGRHSFFSINSINYTSLKNTTIQHTGYSHIRANYFRRRKISFENFAQYQYDQARGLQNRFLAGGGIRTAITRSENFNLHLGNSLMYEFEEWRVPGTDENLRITRLPKLSNYLSGRLKFNEYVELNGIIYYQTGFDKNIDQFRHRVSGETNISSKITSKIRFKTSFNATFDDRPVVPVTRFLYNLNMGIQASF